MDTLCSCGSLMHLQLCQLKLVQARPVVVNHVPIVHCEQCGRSEVYSAVKEALNHVMVPANRNHVDRLDFEMYSECANYLVRLEDHEIDMEVWINQLCDRMDDLLDLLGFAMSTEDQAWSDDIQRRLRELHVTIQTTYHFS